MSMIEFLLNCYVIALDMLGLSSRTGTSRARTSQSAKP